MNGSLLLCDVAFLKIGSDDQEEEDDINNRSCHIVLPFMNGLDSDDDVDHDEQLPIEVKWDSSDDSEIYLFDSENLQHHDGISTPIDCDDISEHSSQNHEADSGVSINPLHIF
jgi:hypothetical protein